MIQRCKRYTFVLGISPQQPLMNCSRSRRLTHPLRDDDDMPLGTSGGSAAIVNDYLYIFGGYTDDGNSNNLYRLNLFSFKWELMEPGGLAPTPCDKTSAWEHDGRLYIFGGYGVEPDYNERHRRQLDSQFLLDTNSHWVSYSCNPSCWWEAIASRQDYLSCSGLGGERAIYVSKVGAMAFWMATVSW